MAINRAVTYPGLSPRSLSPAGRGSGVGVVSDRGGLHFSDDVAEIGIGCELDGGNLVHGFPSRERWRHDGAIYLRAV